MKPGLGKPKTAGGSCKSPLIRQMKAGGGEKTDHSGFF